MKRLLIAGALLSATAFAQNTPKAQAKPTYEQLEQINSALNLRAAELQKKVADYDLMAARGYFAAKHPDMHFDEDQQMFVPNAQTKAQLDPARAAEKK